MSLESYSDRDIMEQFSKKIDRATAYCTYCPKMCRFSCPAAEAEERETVTPWGMMRLFEFVKDGSVEPSEEVAETFYHCMGCRRCQEWCLHDNDVPEALWEARAMMRRAGHVPDELEDFPEEFRQNNAPQRHVPKLPEVHGFTADDVFDQESTTVYMPDCEVRYGDPEAVVRAGLLLEIFNGSKVALHTRRIFDEGDRGFGCCGFPMLSAGDEAGYEEYRAELESAFVDADRVVTDCGGFAALYREESSWGREGDLDVVHMVDFLAERLDFVDVRATVDLDEAMIHDSCFLGRQLGLYEEVRTLLDAFCGEELGEFQFNRHEAPCCGGPSHYHVVAPEASERCARERLEQMEREGGEQVVCGLRTCSKSFARADGDGVAIDLLEIACRAFEL